MSVYTTALNGLQVQARAAQQYAQNLAGATVTLSADKGGELPQDIVDFSDAAIEAIIGLGMAEHIFKANTKMIAVQGEMDQALLDILS